MPRALRRADRARPGRPVTVTGVQGSLRWGYHVAASIRDWTITRTARTSTLTGGVASVDRFRTTQRPLYFVALIQGGAWQWPVVRLEINDRTVRAELGPQET
jgi:hypothetical protein